MPAQILHAPCLLHCCLTPQPSVHHSCVQVAAKMRAAGIRVQLMERASIPKMIRTAEKAKTPVMCVIGQKEADTDSLAVRLYGGGDLGQLPVQDLVHQMVKAVAGRTTLG